MITFTIIYDNDNYKYNEWTSHSFSEVKEMEAIFLT